MNKDSKTVKLIKQNMYKLHRTLGIITIIPVLFWTLSGLMHPLMAHFLKPTIAHEKLETKQINASQLKFSVQEVLTINKLDVIKNFRIVSFDNKTFYQIKNLFGDYQYFDASNAIELKNGDLKYAEYLSRYFLDDYKSKVVKIELLTEFTSQYKYINRYLPVYKLTFNRDDAMQIYVETSSSKLATFNPKSRQIFIWVFDNFHNWAFIDAISNNYLRIITMLLLLSIISFSAIAGIVIYGFMWKKFKKITPTDSEGFLRKNHRKIGILVSFLTLTFAFSGGFHATQKWQPNNLPKMIFEPLINVSDLPIASTKLNVNNYQLTNISVVKFKKNCYFQCSLFDSETEEKTVVYINSKLNKLENIEIDYAKFLVSKFQKMLLDPEKGCCEMDGNDTSTQKFELKSASILTEFDKREYGFVNKRLPVVRLDFKTNDNLSFYIEPSTSRLAAVVNSGTRIEGYSFAILHKFLFMEWAGKNIRDFVTVISVLGILVVSLLGLILFIKKKNNN